MEDNEIIRNTIALAEESAIQYFRQGLNCSECVMLSFMEHFNHDLSNEALALATGFGGGMGHTKNTCGAITGAVMALSSVIGRQNPFEKETVPERIQELKEIYQYIAPMVNEIEQTYGSLICKEISAPLGEFEGKARKKNCMQIIGYCSGLAVKYAQLTKEEQKGVGTP